MIGLALKQPDLGFAGLKANYFPNHTFEEVFAALYDCPTESREEITKFIMNSRFPIESILEANKGKPGEKSLSFAQLCRLYETSLKKLP